jgi:hypothetical protein
MSSEWNEQAFARQEVKAWGICPWGTISILIDYLASQFNVILFMFPVSKAN